MTAIADVGRRGERRAPAIRLRARSFAAVGLASVIGGVALCWPFVVAPGRFASSTTPPLMFAALLALVLAVVFAEVADGGIDAKALAMLGVLSAVGAALRPLGAGTAGVETVFFTLVLAGRVFGAGFGFALGCTTLLSSAMVTGGVGPWTPYQMFGCAWVGLIAGLLPRARGRAEVVMLAVYGAVAGYLFGFLVNLSFWPFALDPGSSISYLPGAPFVTQVHRYLAFDATTSLGWDTGRAITNLVLILLVGPAALATFRRAARRARFEAPVGFVPAEAALPTAPSPEGPVGFVRAEAAWAQDWPAASVGVTGGTRSGGDDMALEGSGTAGTPGSFGASDEDGSGADIEEGIAEAEEGTQAEGVHTVPGPGDTGESRRAEIRERGAADSAHGDTPHGTPDSADEAGADASANRPGLSPTATGSGGAQNIAGARVSDRVAAGQPVPDEPPFDPGPAAPA